MDIIENLAKSEGMTKVKAKSVIDTVLESIKRGVSEDGVVQLRNFGTFTKVEKPERDVRNPSNNTMVCVGPSNALKFKVSKKFVESLNF